MARRHARQRRPPVADDEGGVALQLEEGKGNESVAEMGDGRHRSSELNVSRGRRRWQLRIWLLPGFSGDGGERGGGE
jgi:hypothetical protein